MKSRARDWKSRPKTRDKTNAEPQPFHQFVGVDKIVATEILY